jgi:hypothetical protein
MSNDPFRKAEDQFFLLKGQRGAGRITHDQFEAALKSTSGFANYRNVDTYIN